MWKDVLDKPKAQTFLELMNPTVIFYCSKWSYLVN